MAIKLTYFDKLVHEMNNPIQSIYLLSEVMLLDKGKLGEAENKEILKNIYDSAERLKKLPPCCPHLRM